MTVHKMNMNMYKTCSCQYNWIHLKSSGERPNFNIYLSTDDRRQNACATVILTHFNVFAWRVDQVSVFGCISIQRVVEEIECFVLFSFVQFYLWVFWLYQFPYMDTANGTLPFKNLVCVIAYSILCPRGKNMFIRYRKRVDIAYLVCSDLR